MNRKKIILIAGVILLLALIAFLLWWFWWRTPAAEVTPPAKEQEETPLTSLEQLPPPSQEQIEQEKNYPLDLKQLALVFAERFGSFSSDSGFANLNELKELSTDKLRQNFAVYEQSAGNDDGRQSGTETVALNSELSGLKGDQAEVLVKTQRSKYLNGQLISTFYQDLRLKLVKTGEIWKVDEAVWQ